MILHTMIAKLYNNKIIWYLNFVSDNTAMCTVYSMKNRKGATTLQLATAVFAKYDSIPS